MNLAIDAHIVSCSWFFSTQLSSAPMSTTSPSYKHKFHSPSWSHGLGPLDEHFNATS
jgi:hypothetical protein